MDNRCWWVELKDNLRTKGLYYRRCHRYQQGKNGLCLKHNRIFKYKELERNIAELENQTRDRYCKVNSKQDATS